MPGCALSVNQTFNFYDLVEKQQFGLKISDRKIRFLSHGSVFLTRLTTTRGIISPIRNFYHVYPNNI